MDAEFKARVTKIAEASLRNLRVGKLKVTGELFARKTHNWTRETPQKLAIADLRRRLRDRSLLKQFKEEAFKDAARALLAGILRTQELPEMKSEISAAKAKQLELFPGYEHLPVRIKTGSNFLKFHELPVGQFLKYEARYQVRTQTNQQTADELRRLAMAVKPLAEIDPNMPMARAFDRAQAEPPKLTVVEAKKG